MTIRILPQHTLLLKKLNVRQKMSHIQLSKKKVARLR
jgi:hypothetical protein